MMRSRRPTERWPCCCTPTSVQEDGAEEAFKKIGEAYSKLLDEQWWQEYLRHGSVSFEPKATPVMSQKQRKQERREKAKQRYGKSAGPNAHKVTQRRGRAEAGSPGSAQGVVVWGQCALIPGMWWPPITSSSKKCLLQFARNSVMMGVSWMVSTWRTATSRSFTTMSRERLLRTKARVQGSNGTTGATSNGAQAQQASKFEGLGGTGGFGGFGIAGMPGWLQMPNLSLSGMLSCCISRPKWREQRRRLTLELCLPRMLLECGPNLAFLKRKKKICWG